MIKGPVDISTGIDKSLRKLCNSWELLLYVPKQVSQQLWWSFGRSLVWWARGEDSILTDVSEDPVSLDVASMVIGASSSCVSIGSSAAIKSIEVLQIITWNILVEIRELGKMRIHPFSAVLLTGVGGKVSANKTKPQIIGKPQILVLVFSVMWELQPDHQMKPMPARMEHVDFFLPLCIGCEGIWVVLLGFKCVFLKLGKSTGNTCFPKASHSSSCRWLGKAFQRTCFTCGNCWSWERCWVWPTVSSWQDFFPLYCFAISPKGSQLRKRGSYRNVFS